jgi:hypothetical protein
MGGQKAWLWAFAGEDVTVYLIARGRGYEQACEILGQDFSGVLERDGWAPYRQFTAARHQTCHAHLLRRTGELIASSVARQARVPHAARRILKDALRLRDQRDVIDAEEFGLRVRDLPAWLPPSGTARAGGLKIGAERRPAGILPHREDPIAGVDAAPGRPIQARNLDTSGPRGSRRVVLVAQIPASAVERRRREPPD